LTNAMTMKTKATIAPWMGSTSGIPSHMRAPPFEDSRTRRRRRTVSR
jgi:hypothetical protein